MRLRGCEGVTLEVEVAEKAVPEDMLLGNLLGDCVAAKEAPVGSHPAAQRKAKGRAEGASQRP